ncbi:MAG: TIGR03915 family putative DNA repair protein [Treponemataceae bacterium]
MTSRVLIHDGSFPGFLCAGAELLNAISGTDVKGAASVAASDILVRGRAVGIDLFEDAEPVPRDDCRARKLWDRLVKRVGKEASFSVMEAFLSDVPGADQAAARMMIRLWREGAKALDDLSDPNAALVEKASCRTTKESHRFLGLVRFSELSDGSWYSRIDPDCDILSLIAEHFALRFPSMRWAIHDGRRGTAILHESGRQWLKVEDFRVNFAEPAIADGPEAAQPGSGLPLSESELLLRRAWKRYFTVIAIQSRTNPRLQASFMPKKHWKNITEMAPDFSLDDPAAQA